MALQDLLDKALGDGRVRGRAAISKHDVVHHLESGHQFGAGPLGQQRTVGIRNLHYQELAGRGVFAQAPDVRGQQRVEMARDPAYRLVTQAFSGLRGRDDF